MLMQSELELLTTTASNENDWIPALGHIRMC